MTRQLHLHAKTTFLVASLSAGILPMSAQAQSWEYGASIYVWMSGLDTAVETPFGTIETELSFGDILDDLDFAFFATFEARNGPWVILGDLNYTSLETSLATPGPIFSSAEVDPTLKIVSAFGGYAVVDQPDVRLEVGGGLRYYDLDLDTSIVGNIAPGGRSFNFSESWVDPIIGAHLSVPLSDRWFARSYADVGGFGIGDGSELSWQIYVGGGYIINQTWAVEFGYRHLSIEKDLDRATLNMDQAGPLVGVTARF
ncbi:porin family protein [Palleronia sp. KMU-117]|uniref:porin family protein n=1 Tax=Palleronia sp. KMU-117 TaxID=3434108 RepID=UPI003D732B30